MTPRGPGQGPFAPAVPVVSVLVPEHEDPELVRCGAAFATGLTVPAEPDVVSGAEPVIARGPRRVRAAVAASDLLVVAVRAGEPVRATRTAQVPPALRRMLDACGPLDGRVVFALVLGGWPTEAGQAPERLVAELHRRGATCLAPALHLAAGAVARFGPAPQVPGDTGAAISAYCRFWRPVVPSLIDLARRDQIPAAG